MAGDTCIERWIGENRPVVLIRWRMDCCSRNLSLTVSASPTLAQIVFCCICDVLGHQP